MTARHRQAGRGDAKRTLGAQDDRGMVMPDERDQAVGQVAREPAEVIKQAARDLEAGMVDTDMRATPGLDAARRERLVPEPARPTEAKPRPKARPSSPRNAAPR